MPPVPALFRLLGRISLSRCARVRRGGRWRIPHLADRDTRYANPSSSERDCPSPTLGPCRHGVFASPARPRCTRARPPHPTRPLQPHPHPSDHPLLAIATCPSTRRPTALDAALSGTLASRALGRDGTGEELLGCKPFCVHCLKACELGRGRRRSTAVQRVTPPKSAGRQADGTPPFPPLQHPSGN